MSKRIQNILSKALLLNGEMSIGLYEFECEEHLDYWKEGLIRDNDDFVFVLDEKKGHTAMVLITKEELFVNEKARQQLQLLWDGGAYEYNIELMLPAIAKQLSEGILSVNGVKFTAE